MTGNANGPAYVATETALEQVLETFRRWLYLPDPTPLLAVLGTIAANQLDGDPVWTVLVGAPGDGKSELLGGLGDLADVHPVATLTEASLLSGTPRRDKANGATGGLLRKIGDSGVIVCKDFGSVLSMNRDARAAVLAALREVYDGAWTRHVGTDGGKTLSWSGKVGLLAGCTPTIDRHHAVMGAMGERFLLVRMPRVDSAEQARRALGHAGHETAMREQLAGAVADLLGPLRHPRHGPLTDAARERLIAVTELVVRCRSAVERDGSSSREIELIPAPEAPTRLVVVLDRLLAGLGAIAVEPATAWQVVTSAALDSIPALRRAVLDELHRAIDELETAEVAERVSYPRTTANRALEELAAHGIVEVRRQGQGKATRWRLSDWASERYAAALTSPETSDIYLQTKNTQTNISGEVVTGGAT